MDFFPAVRGGHSGRLRRRRSVPARLLVFQPHSAGHLSLGLFPAARRARGCHAAHGLYSLGGGHARAGAFTVDQAHGLDDPRRADDRPGASTYGARPAHRPLGPARHGQLLPPPALGHSAGGLHHCAAHAHIHREVHPAGHHLHRHLRRHGLQGPLARGIHPADGRLPRRGRAPHGPVHGRGRSDPESANARHGRGARVMAGVFSAEFRAQRGLQRVVHCGAAAGHAAQEHC